MCANYISSSGALGFLPPPPMMPPRVIRSQCGSGDSYFIESQCEPCTAQREKTTEPRDEVVAFN